MGPRLHSEQRLDTHSLWEGVAVVSKHRQQPPNDHNPYIRTIIVIGKVSLTRVF